MENKDSGEKKSCCSSCCCGKKLFLGILLGIILASISIGFFCAGKGLAYSGGLCPFTQTHR